VYRFFIRASFQQNLLLLSDTLQFKLAHFFGSRPDGRKPILAKYVNKPTKLRARFKGKTVTARVRQNGIITSGGKQFTSPSLAAAFACGRRTCNGWAFWQYERAPGDWVPLANLRK
jgi:hypothetical protein